MASTALRLFFLFTVFTSIFASSSSSSDDQGRRCPRSITLAIGVVTFQSFVPNSAGEGVTFATLTKRGFTTKLIDNSTTGENPTYCANGAHGALYCVNENAEGSLTRIDRNGNSLTTPTNAGGSTHLAVVQRHNGELIVVANFGGAVSSHFFAKGRLTTQDTYEIPMEFAAGTEFPQEAPHPHHILPFNKHWFLVTDLGSDRIWHFEVDNMGRLHRRGSVRVPKGDGPRHSVRGRGRNVYTANEVANTVRRLGSSRSFVITDGTPRSEGDSAAAIRISKDRRFLYVSLRRAGTANGSIVAWKLRGNGKIGKRIGVFSSGGVHPRDFFIVEKAPDCNSYIAVVNRDSNNLLLFKRNRRTGRIAEQPRFSLDVTTPTSVLQVTK